MIVFNLIPNLVASLSPVLLPLPAILDPTGTVVRETVAVHTRTIADTRTITNTDTRTITNSDTGTITNTDTGTITNSTAGTRREAW
jgi:hypothetical protein